MALRDGAEKLSEMRDRMRYMAGGRRLPGIVIMALLTAVSALRPAAGFAADGRTVYCMGETVVDILFRGAEVIGANVGGSALNTAVSLARAGAKVEFIGEAGTDSTGQHVRSFLRAEGVGTGCLRMVDGVKTSVSAAYLDREGEAHYYFYADRRAEGSLIVPAFHKDDVLLLSSFFAVSPAYRADVQRILEAAHTAGVIVYYDINLRSPHAAMMKSLLPAVRANMAAATILRAGGGDLKTVFGSSRSDSIYKHVVSPLCTRFVRTSNDKEVKIFDGGKLKAEVDVNPVKSVSRIGAGDNFNAGFLFALLRENVTGDALARGLSASTWRKMVQTGLDFSRESCRQIGNYIPRDYAAKLRDRK